MYKGPEVGMSLGETSKEASVARVGVGVGVGDKDRRKKDPEHQGLWLEV